MYGLPVSGLVIRLGGDPTVEMVPTRDGKKENPVVKFSGANSQKTKTDDGKQFTIWWNCSSWNTAIIEQAERFLRKGFRVVIYGDGDIRPYTSRDGQEKLSHDVVVNRIELIDFPDRDEDDRDDQRSNSRNNSSRDREDRNDRGGRDTRRTNRDDERDSRPRRDDRSDRRPAAPPRRTRDEDYDDDRPARKSTASPRAAAPPEEEEDDVPFK